MRQSRQSRQSRLSFFPLPRQNETTGGASSAACRLESRITRLQSPLRRFSLSLPPPERVCANSRHAPSWRALLRCSGVWVSSIVSPFCEHYSKIPATCAAISARDSRRAEQIVERHFGLYDAGMLVALQYGILKIIIMTKSRIYNKIWSNWAISFASRVAQAATQRPRARFRRPTPGQSRWCRTAGPLLCAPRPPSRRDGSRRGAGATSRTG